jgi:hypothetical protein
MAQSVIITERNRPEVARRVAALEAGSRVTVASPVEKPKSNPQTNRFHAMIRDVARQMPEYYGVHMDENSWKDVFLDALFKGQTRLVPALDRSGMVALRPHWRALSVPEATEGITIVMAFGDQNGIKFKADEILEASYK